MLKECTELGRAGEPGVPAFADRNQHARVPRYARGTRAHLTRLRKIRRGRRSQARYRAPSRHRRIHSRAPSSKKHTDKDRYVALAEEMAATARRMVICGMHVHVGLEDDELRIDLMKQLSYLCRHLLALSCSSPFWEGENTGLKSFRLTVFSSLPRTGLPENFASYGGSTSDTSAR